MAKLRVCELAKELNMENTKLIEGLQAMGVEVKNYLSYLDDDALRKAREMAKGAAQAPDHLERTRVKSNVIRRRKMVQTPAQEPAPLQAAPEEESLRPPTVPVVPVPEPEPPVEVAPISIKEPEHMVPVPVEEEPVAHEAVEEGQPVPVSPVEEAPAEEDMGVETSGEEVSQPPAAQEDSVLPLEEAPVEVEEAGEEQVPHEAHASMPLVREAVSESQVGLAERAKSKPKKGKRDRATPSARIISLPEDGPMRGLLLAKAESKPEVEVREPVPAPVMAPPTPVAAPVEEEADADGRYPKKKKEKKKGAAEEAAKVPPKVRRKEVYERADLYEGKELRLKTRKPVRKGRRDWEDFRTGRPLQEELAPPKPLPQKKKIKVQDTVTVGDLARAMGIKGSDLIKKMMLMGFSATINKSLDFDTAVVVADEFGHELELDVFDEKTLLDEAPDRPEDLRARPPVVTIMGHVDHGKTSLLDYIRKSNVAGGESGGITQHIGAYYVKQERGDIVFLDTPGHEAFTAMRARGAKVTDIIVLVVAADDGVMPQTREAINHARAAGIPIVVAVNKMDKPGANPEKVKRELADLQLAPEEWGGQTLYGLISAKTGLGVDDLLNLILLQAEMLELSGNPKKGARGTIIEAKLDKNKGPVATVLIKNGTLKQGDSFICGELVGKVRAMHNHRGRKLRDAGPSMPVEIYGITGVPNAGDEFLVVQDERLGKQIVENRKGRMKKDEISKRGLVSLDDFYQKIKQGEVKDLNIVLKADVQGSLGALGDSLSGLSTKDVKVRIIHSGTGAITESDVMLAYASGAIVIGFSVRANPRAVEIGERERVDIRYYDVIYNVIQDIRAAMTGLLEPVYKDLVIGHADVREIFRVPKVGTVAGCQVTDGHVMRNANARLLRDGSVVYTGKVGSLRRFKEDVKDVQTGYECGIGMENFSDLKPGDVLEFYQVETVKAEL